MTTFEFFKEQYEKNKIEALKTMEYGNEIAIKKGWEIKPIPQIDSFEFVKRCTKINFGGCYNLNEKVSDITEMRDKKLIGYQYYSNWQARQLHQQDFYWLTVNGLKAFYKAMF